VLIPDSSGPDIQEQSQKHALRFSRAGVPLKFSELRNIGKNARLTIPVSGAGGDRIIKMPSERHPDVPENEFVAMSLASGFRINVPTTERWPRRTRSGALGLSPPTRVSDAREHGG
jgi:serine/threonine-protein kinase HipA